MPKYRSREDEEAAIRWMEFTKRKVHTLQRVIAEHLAATEGAGDDGSPLPGQWRRAQDMTKKEYATAYRYYR
jgi:hypothetical protein